MSHEIAAALLHYSTCPRCRTRNLHLCYEPPHSYFVQCSSCGAYTEHRSSPERALEEWEKFMF